MARLLGSGQQTCPSPPPPGPQINATSAPALVRPRVPPFASLGKSVNTTETGPAANPPGRTRTGVEATEPASIVSGCQPTQSAPSGANVPDDLFLLIPSQSKHLQLRYPHLGSLLQLNPLVLLGST